MNAAPFADWTSDWVPHLAAVALCGARLAPIAYLCPALGGPAVPGFVRLGLVLSFGSALHVAGGIQVPLAGHSGWALIAMALREAGLGTALGLLAALPFEAARMGGSFIDLFRGASAEAALPWVGIRESASGDALYPLAIALAAASGALSLVWSGIWRTFVALPLGDWGFGTAGVDEVAARMSSALAAALCVGAPVAAASLLVDALVGFASRVAPLLPLNAAAPPAKLLLGGGAMWLGLGLICERLLAEISGAGR